MADLPKREDFQSQLINLIAEARANGASFIDVQAGELHRQLGGYPGTNHRMPVCCDVMYKVMKKTDEVVSAPAKGKGASLTIRYYV